MVSAGGHCEQFRHGQGRPLFDVVCSAFSLPTATSPTIQGAVKNGSEETAVVLDVGVFVLSQLPEGIPVSPQARLQ